MDSIITELLVAILTAAITAFITWMEKEGYDNDMEDMYTRYKAVFDISGQIVKSIDEQLYIEMEQAVAKMKLAYESPEFTNKAFREIVKECKDVFDRAQVLIKNRKE